jgi:hypothetical protein
VVAGHWGTDPEGPVSSVLLVKKKKSQKGQKQKKNNKNKTLLKKKLSKKLVSEIRFDETTWDKKIYETNL